MHVIRALILLFTIRESLTLRTWPVRDSATLLQVVGQAEPGDVIELEAGDYIFTTPPSGAQLAPILLNKPVTLRSRDKRQRAVLVNNGASMLIAITSSLVTISDLVIGAQLSAGDERSIDVLIGAGTQTHPSGVNAYYTEPVAEEDIALRKRAVVQKTTHFARNEILAARGMHKAVNAAEKFRKRSLEVSADGEMRVIDHVKIENVDFSASRSGTNVAFARGSYASISINTCVFGRQSAPYINALVSVGDAQFVDIVVRSNMFFGAAHILIGSPAVEAEAFGLNYWGSQGTRPQVYIGGSELTPETYCLDAACTRLAPVVDGADVSRVFPTLQAAVDAGVTILVITDNIELTKPVIITNSYTTIQALSSCDGAPIVSMSAGSAIVSVGSALVGVRNLRMALRGPNTVGFVFTDGAPQRLVVARFAQPLLAQKVPAGDVDAADGDAFASTVVLFDGVSFIGDQSTDQVGVLISAPRVSVEIEDVVLLQLQYGVVAHRGSVVSVDSTFFSADASAIYAETVTHQAALRVSGSTFEGCAVAIELGAGASSNTLREFDISCSQFLFNKRRNPIAAHDCDKKPTLCAAAVKYSTIVTDFPLIDPNVAAGERDARMFKQGANHVEHGRKRDEYVYFGAPNQQFSLTDTHGRLSWVTGALSASAVNTSAYLIASYAPMRAECFEVDGVSPEASVVSDVLEVRSDSLLHGCAQLASRFRIDDVASLPPTLAVFGVAHLGTRSQWVRAVATTHPAADGQATIESSIAVHSIDDDKHTHRLVVVALEALPDQLQSALAFGSATANDAARPIGKRLCVVCTGETIALPAQYLDEFCGGSTDNVRTSFDAAYLELGFGSASGAPRATDAALYIYGDCTTSMCTVDIGNREHIEGTSPRVRGSLKTTCAAAERTRGDDDERRAFIRFTPRASSHSSLRHMIIDSVAPIAVHVEASSSPSNSNGSPTIAYCTIGSMIYVDSRDGGRYLNNDLGGPRLAVAFVLANGAGRQSMLTQPTIIQANRISSGGILVAAPADVRIDRNSFGENGAIVADSDSEGGILHITANEGLMGLENAGCNMSAIGNKMGEGAIVNLSGHDSFVGGVKAKMIKVDFHLAKSARLTNVNLDAHSHVHVAAGSDVVLRGVHFDDIGASLRGENQLDSCDDFELTAPHIDLRRSLITAGDGDVVTLTADQASEIANDMSSFWALTGTLSRCADGQPIVRTPAFCGCESDRAAAATKQPRAGADNDEIGFADWFAQQTASVTKHAQDFVVQQTTSQIAADNTALIVILSVLGGLIVICLLIGFCFCLTNARKRDNERMLTYARAGAHVPNEPYYDTAADVDDAHTMAFLIGPRKRTAASKAGGKEN